MRTVILPKRNEADLEDLPGEVPNDIDFVFVETIDEVLDGTLEPAKKTKRRKRKASPDSSKG